MASRKMLAFRRGGPLQLPTPTVPARVVPEFALAPRTIAPNDGAPAIMLQCFPYGGAAVQRKLT